MVFTLTKRIAVIGGGASGLASAIEAKRQAKKLNIDLSVTVFEHLPKCAKKILATGNGRCNFCNTKISEKNYNGDKDIIKSVLESDFSDTLSFFKSFGILPYFEDGRVYPRSEQATSIREALLKTCEILNIKLKTEIPVKEIENSNNKFTIDNEDFDAVIIATGGNSQKPQGSDGSGYKLLKDFGHKITDISPALTAITVEEKDFKDAIAALNKAKKETDSSKQKQESLTKEITTGVEAGSSVDGNIAKHNTRNDITAEIIEKEEKASEILAGKIIVVSGNFSISREKIKEMIAANGGKCSGSISSKTTYLLAGEKAGPEKLKKAETLGVALLTEEELYRMIDPKKDEAQEEYKPGEQLTLF